MIHQIFASESAASQTHLHAPDETVPGRWRGSCVCLIVLLVGLLTACTDTTDVGAFDRHDDTASTADTHADARSDVDSTGPEDTTAPSIDASPRVTDTQPGGLDIPLPDVPSLGMDTTINVDMSIPPGDTRVIPPDEDTSSVDMGSDSMDEDTLPDAQSDSDTSSGPTFGAPDDAQIRPGVLVTFDGSQCTSNFIYTDALGTFYIGAAAHCFSPDANSGLDPCESNTAPLESPVEIENAQHPGYLAYVSWASMQTQGETIGSGICQGNDFALVRIDPRDHPRVHPAAQVFGGPTALLVGDAAIGDAVYSYGQSTLHLGVSTLERKEGTIQGQSNGGWTYDITTDNPGLPGDSGSAVLHESGQALGVLATVGTCIGLCTSVANGVVSLDRALSYTNDAAVISSPVTLVSWPDFTP